MCSVSENTSMLLGTHGDKNDLAVSARFESERSMLREQMFEFGNTCFKVIDFRGRKHPVKNNADSNE